MVDRPAARARSVVFAVFVVKCVVWDAVLGLGTTEPLGGDIHAWDGWVMALWFGGRSLEQIATLIWRVK